MCRQAPFTNTTEKKRQTHDPSAPHTRPDAAQFGVQHRWVPFKSTEQVLEAHWSPAVQGWALGSRPLQTPVAALQPLPHWLVTMEPTTQQEADKPRQEEPAPSHWTHREPSSEQKLPAAHACAQQMLPPLTLLTHALDAHALFCAQA